jgi:hypothetical protein
MTPATAVLASADLAQSPGGSAVVAALEGLYDAIQAHHPELPDCVLITGSGFRGRAQIWGHFRADAWREAAAAAAAGDQIIRRPEMFIAGETLAQGAAHTLCVLLHEAAHALAAVRGIKDTSRGGRYHNRRFVALAVELGLRHPSGVADKVHGLNETVLAEGTTDQYAAELDALTATLPLILDTLERLRLTPADPEGGPAGDDGQGAEPEPEPKAPNRNNLKATCQCGRIIRASAAVLDGPDIVCSECDTPFTAED